MSMVKYLSDVGLLRSKGKLGSNLLKKCWLHALVVEVKGEPAPKVRPNRTWSPEAFREKSTGQPC